VDQRSCHLGAGCGPVAPALLTGAWATERVRIRRLVALDQAGRCLRSGLLGVAAGAAARALPASCAGAAVTASATSRSLPPNWARRFWPSRLPLEGFSRVAIRAGPRRCPRKPRNAVPQRPADSTRGPAGQKPMPATAAAKHQATAGKRRLNSRPQSDSLIPFLASTVFQRSASSSSLTGRPKPHGFGDREAAVRGTRPGQERRDLNSHRGTVVRKAHATVWA